MVSFSKPTLLRLGGMLFDWLQRRLKQAAAKRKDTAATESSMPRRPPAASTERYDSSRNLTRRPVAAVPAAATKILISTDNFADKALSARGLRRRLRDPQSLRQAILINEILDKPLALRRHRRGGR